VSLMLNGHIGKEKRTFGTQSGHDLASKQNLEVLVSLWGMGGTAEKGLNVSSIVSFDRSITEGDEKESLTL
jgi:hypothetical protein